MMSLSKMLILFFMLVCLVAKPEPCRAQNTIQDYLNAHNTARKAVNRGLLNMTWDGALANYANNYVRSLLSNCRLVHSNTSYGENLANGTGTLTGTAAVKLWTDEKSCYVYSSDSCLTSATCKFGCLHYTQVVWRETVRVGCARLRCTNGGWFVSCNYDPPGNYVGEKPY